MWRTVLCGLVLVGIFALSAAVPGQTDRGTDPAQTLAPRRATIPAARMSLAKALAELSEQTGIAVQDRRTDKRSVRLSRNVDKAAFWDALDSIAGDAGAGIYLYESDGVIALVDPPKAQPPVSTDGAFRFALKRVVVARNLETGVHDCTSRLEIAWEPWFQPFLLEVVSYQATFAPDQAGKKLEVKRKGTGHVPVDGRSAVEVELGTPAPDRSSPALDSLKGAIAVIGALKMHHVVFKDLGSAEKGKAQTERPEKGVAITLDRLDILGPNEWVVKLTLDYPADGPTFESFRNQSWLVNNRIYLEKTSASGKVRLLSNPNGEENLMGHRAIITYHFEDEGGKTGLGKPSDWTLVYRTPGRIVQAKAAFELKKVPLP
jgi:hypothetical protein